MKKLFKEVWKSFSKSKVILFGLIILIFLTSGIITLIFDVVNSYNTQFSTFKQKSVLQDITMNSQINFYGSSPSTFYKKKNSNQKYLYVNTENLLENQWVYEDKQNSYIDFVQINSNSDFFNLKLIDSSITTDSYVKTRDLSYILNANYDFGNINQSSNVIGNSVEVELKNTSIKKYTKPSEEFADVVKSITNLNDKYDSVTKTWSSTNDTTKLYSPGWWFVSESFNEILIDKETKKAYVKKVLIGDAWSSEEGKKWKNNPSSFIEISSTDVGLLLGFKNFELDTNSNWILDADIKQYTNGTKAKNFFAQQSIPKIKNTFDLLETIVIEETLTKINIPLSWFVYSKYKNVYTKNIFILEGIDSNNEVKDQWTGYFKDYLNWLKEHEFEKFQSFALTSYWTKDIYVEKVDYQGNIIKQKDLEGNDVTDSSLTKRFENVEISNDDLVLPITNKNNKLSTLAAEEGISNIGSDSSKLISTDKSSSNVEQIKSEALKFKNNQVYNKLKEISDKLGIRETITINSNENNKTKTFQFINLGNSNNEIEWNGINIKQDVGKLINSNLESKIFSSKSNIDAQASKVPNKYLPQILEQLLTGLSLNRDYINPMISFNSFVYGVDENGNPLSKNGAKIVWLTKDGQKDLNNVYGVTAMYVNGSKNKTYFILKKNQNELKWDVQEKIEKFDSFSNYIIENQLNFAPFDINGNDLQIVSNKGWIRQDDVYSDKYSVAFQYYLPNSDLLNNYDYAQKHPEEGKYGMELFRDNLINGLTTVVKPLISAPIWDTLANGINTAFSKYGFADGLKPPAALTNETIVKIILGVFRDSISNFGEAFVNPFLTGLIDGIKRKINPDGNTDLETQKNTLMIEMSKLSKVLLMTTGMNIPFESFISQIKDPSKMLDGIKELFSSINLDQAMLDIWNSFIEEEKPAGVDAKTIGTGDIIPSLYRNIYSTEKFKHGLKTVLENTTFGHQKTIDLIEPYIPPNLLPIIKLVLGNLKIYETVDIIEMEEPKEGAKKLEINTYFANQTIEVIQNNINVNKTIANKTIKINHILDVFSIVGFSIGSFIPNEQETIIHYNPFEMKLFELDMDLMWYLNNYVFVENKTKSNTKPMEFFGIDLGNFLTLATLSFVEVKDDYNQISMVENDGKLAIVNQAFLDQNNKKIYQSNNLENEINDLSKISDEYKINISGVEYLIIGSDFSVDYMYPALNAENITVNTKTQALVYVNQHGYDRIKRSNAAAPTEKYFLIKAKENQDINLLQTELNTLVYEWITGQKPNLSYDINNNSNPYKYAYLTRETSLLNPERALRITMIDQMISNLQNMQKIIGIMLFIIVSIVIMFIVYRYIGSRAKVLGILKSQGYSSFQISTSICLFPLFVSIIGATLGYVAGLVSQYGVFKLFSIFWTIPIITIPFNWLTFTLTLIIPIVLLCFLTVITTLWFLHKNKPLSMMNGSIEVNDTSFSRSINKLAARTSIKNKFSVSIALGSIGKLIALFISSIFTAGVTLFFVASYKTFDKSITRTYKNKNYSYISTYVTPTIEGKELQTYYVVPNGWENIHNSNFKNIADHIGNMLYVPVGDVGESYVYYSNYFKPGYNPIINKDGANGNILPNDIETPHIFSKASVDLTIEAGGMSINVWNNLYNAIPESQRASIISKSQISNQWLEWTQEGVLIIDQNNNEYITKYAYDQNNNEYLSLIDKKSREFVKNPNTGDNVKLEYFNFEKNEINPAKSRFIYREPKIVETEQSNGNKVKEEIYENHTIKVTGLEPFTTIRKKYRKFLVEAYQKMFRFNVNNKYEFSLLNEDERSPMPEYSLDYFISPGAVILGVDNLTKTNDETFTYIDAKYLNNESIRPKIYGYKEDSQYIKILDASGNNLIQKANKFNEKDMYPLIVNNVVAKKYGFNEGDILDISVGNKYTRYQDRLKEEINKVTNNKIAMNTNLNKIKFKIIGINDTYINEEWVTSQKIANKIIGLGIDGYNGMISNSIEPTTLVNSLSLYSFNGYWSANNKIFSSSLVSELSNSELQNLINTYREIFYKIDPGSLNNISLMANYIKAIFPNFTNSEINELIKKMVGLDDLNIEYDEKADNVANATKANEAIKIFTNIYTDDSLYAYLENISSNGVEKEYVSRASNTINQTMLLLLAITFIISLTVLVMITSIIITDNERNIAIFGILGYTTKEKIRMFFSIYIPIVFLSNLISILFVWLAIPLFLTTILANTSILLPMSLSIIHVLIASAIITFVFAITCIICWIVQGKIKPIILLKGV